MNTHSSPAAAPPSVCLFGGSFDPVHCGHLALAVAAHDRFDLERLIFIPCRRSPFKTSGPVASTEERLTMLRLAIEALPWAEVSTIELERPEPSYSWQTARHFAETLPRGTRLGWLLGADQWQSLESWARPDLLGELLCFIVVPRGSEEVGPKPGFSHLVLDVRHDASATAIRKRVAEGRSIQGLVPEKVARYIAERQLFVAGQPKP